MHPLGRGHAGIPARVTTRAGSGVCRQYVPVLSANSRASCARPFGLFLHLLAATWRGPGWSKGRARQSLPQRLLALLLISGPSVKRRRSAGKGRVHRTRCGPGRPAFGDRAGALPPNPADRSEPAALRPARNRGCISLVTFFVQAKKVTRPPGSGRNPTGTKAASVRHAPKKAKALGPRLRGDDE